MTNPGHLCIIAGEPSGDQLGAHMINALKRARPAGLTFSGIGGHLMAEEGFQSYFPMDELAVMGLVELLPHLRRIKARLVEATSRVMADNPAAVITIDAPGFTWRLAARLREAGYKGPILHYVAPTVWAWRPKRAQKLAGLVNHVLCLLPFEPPYFEEAGLKATFVGHPVLTLGIENADAEAFRASLALDTEDDVALLLLGSRRGEIQRHAEIFKTVAAELLKRHPNLTFVLPTIPPLKTELESIISAWPFKAVVIDSQVEKFAAYKAASLALAVSGTVSLELAVAGAPSLIAYRMNPLTFQLVKRLIKVRHASLVNILEDAPVVPEFIQNNCEAPKIYQKALTLLDDKQARMRQQEGYARALAKLHVTESSPGALLAETVLSYVKN